MTDNSEHVNELPDVTSRQSKLHLQEEHVVLTGPQVVLLW